MRFGSPWGDRRAGLVIRHDADDLVTVDATRGVLEIDLAWKIPWTPWYSGAASPVHEHTMAIVIGAAAAEVTDAVASPTAARVPRTVVNERTSRISLPEPVPDFP